VHEFKPLFEALNGKQPEKQAVRTVAVYAVIPGSMIGMLVGAFAVPMAAHEQQLLLWGSVGAFVGGVGSLLLIVLLHRRLSFRAVVRFSYSFFGFLAGLALGTTLGWRTTDWVPYALGVAGALLVPLVVVPFLKAPSKGDQRPVDGQVPGQVPKINA
jgi:hypothetical protein